jgi:UDP-glucuronate 4-epimerase
VTDPLAPLRGRRILVSGAAGFIGMHLCLRLLEAGAEVTGFDNLNDYYAVALKHDRLAHLRAARGAERFRFVQLDVADQAGVLALWREAAPEAVVHLAAQAGVRYSLENPHAYMTSNMTGFLSVLEACRHHPVGQLLYASSSSVYGANTKVPFAETDEVNRPASLYAVTKRGNELMAHSYAQLFGIPATGLRFFTVYGPWGRPDMAYYKFTSAILEGRQIDVYNNGALWRDFTYVAEVVTAIARLLAAPAPAADAPPGTPGQVVPGVAHRLFNIGNHTPVRLDRFIDVIEAAVGRRAIRVPRPMQPGDVERTHADVSALAAAVDFSPSTRLEEGIGAFVEWYRGYHRPD